MQIGQQLGMAARQIPRWLAVTLQDRELWFAFRNSLIIGGLNALLATLLGTMAALAIARHRFVGRKGFLNLLHYPVLLPEIIIGVALLVLFVLLDVPRGFDTVVAGHVTFSFPRVPCWCWPGSRPCRAPWRRRAWI